MRRDNFIFLLQWLCSVSNITSTVYGYNTTNPHIPLRRNAGMWTRPNPRRTHKWQARKNKWNYVWLKEFTQKKQSLQFTCKFRGSVTLKQTVWIATCLNCVLDLSFVLVGFHLFYCCSIWTSSPASYSGRAAVGAAGKQSSRSIIYYHDEVISMLCVKSSLERNEQQTQILYSLL